MLRSAIFLSILISVFIAQSTYSFQPLFNARIDYQVGDAPQSVFSADLDGDGDCDLAVANNGSNNVSILKNNGDGTFATRVNYGTGTYPRSVFAADLDGDGDQDLATTHEFYVAILKNNGDGTFAAAVNYGVGNNCNSVFAADLDGDGDFDLAVANYLSDNVSILENNGDGSFQTAVTYGAADGPRSLIGADFDADGDFDLAVANYHSNNVSILKNNGDGTFVAAVNYGAGDNPYSVLAADLDGDGDMDLAVAGTSSINRAVTTLNNNGDGAFAPMATYDKIGSNPRSIFAADVDSDGDQDLAVAAFSSANLSILKNNGYGTFAAVDNYAVGSGPCSVYAADLDGDDDLDLAVANNGTDNVSILRNEGEGTFVAAANYGVAWNQIYHPWSVTSADLDSDGDQDLAVAQDIRIVLVAKNDGDGTLAEPVMYYVADGSPNSVSASDLDADGDIDLAVANEYPAYASILKNNGSGTFAPAVNYTTGAFSTSVAMADFDADGDQDLAVTNRDSNSVSLLKNTGFGTFTPRVNYGAGGGPYSVFAADLDVDGDLDLAVANNSSNNVSILRNNNDGTFATRVNYGTGTYPRSVFAADLDSDGDQDLAVANYGSHSVSILRNNGDGTFAAAINYESRYNPHSVFAADLDGDSDQDLAVANYGSNNISILRNNGDATFIAAVNYAVGSGPISVYATDLDTDGDQDLAVANQNSDNLSILTNLTNGSGVASVTGSVQDRSSGEGIPGITVRLWQNGQVIDSTVTQNSGVYNFANVNSATYQLKVNAVGYYPFERVENIAAGWQMLQPVFLYSTSQYTSSAPLLSALESFRTAFRSYFSSDCVRIRFTLDFQFNLLGDPNYSLGRTLTTELTNRLPYSSASVLTQLLNSKNIFTQGNGMNIGSFVYWTGVNTYLQSIKNDLTSYLATCEPPGDQIYSTRAIIMQELTPDVYSMADIMDKLSEPIGNALPDYVPNSFPMTAVVNDLNGLSALLQKYSVASLENPLPRRTAYERLPGSCDIDDMYTMPLGDLGQNWKSFKTQYENAIAQERRTRLVATVCNLGSGIKTIKGIPTDLKTSGGSQPMSDLSFFAWTALQGCQTGVFLADIINAATAGDLSINFMNYNGYWPMKLAELYRSYIKFKDAIINAAENPSVLNCSQSLYMPEPPYTPDAAVPEGMDYAVGTGQYVIGNSDPVKEAKIRVEGKVYSVRTLFGLFHWRSEVSYFSTPTYTIPANQELAVPVQYLLPELSLFDFSTHFEIAPTFIATDGCTPGPVTTAHSISGVGRDTQQWYEHTNQVIGSALYQGQEIIQGLSNDPGALWNRIRLRFPGGDVDLHLYDNIGGHVGRNYSTGLLEFTIPDAVFSGDSTNEETIDFKVDPSRTYQLKVVGVSLPDSMAVYVNQTVFFTVASQPRISPRSFAGFGKIEDTIVAQINLYDLSGQNAITVSDFTVTSLICPSGDTLKAADLMLKFPLQVLPDSSGIIEIKLYANSSRNIDTYLGSAQLLTDAGSFVVPVAIQLTPADMCGDANDNELINILDVTYIISYLYRSGPAPVPLNSGDVNGNGVVNILDVTYLIGYLYKGGPAPVCP